MYCPYCHSENSGELPCFCQPPVQESEPAMHTLSSLPLQHPIAANSNSGARVD